MTLIVPCFFAHQPFRLRAPEQRRAEERTGANGLVDDYFDASANKEIFLQVARSCYVPAARLFLDLVQRNANQDKPFRLALGISGTLLMQAEQYAPELLSLWKQLADTGAVEFVGGPYFRSLAGLLDDGLVEFRAQAALHAEAIYSFFGQRPAVFCNTEMIYNNDIAACVQDMGYRGMMTEGVDWLMAGWRSPDFVYQSPSGLPVLLRNYRLSDDIGYRFADKTWDAYPLTAQTFAGWLARNTDPVVLLALDYEALGEHVRADTGIFDFMAALPEEAGQFPQLEWATPSQALARVPVSGQIDVADYSTISWAGKERDRSAWLGNEMQQFCFEEIKRLGPLLRQNGSADQTLAWRLMQTSDHLSYISEKTVTPGGVQQYFSDYGTVTEAFVRLHTALYDLKRMGERITS